MARIRSVKPDLWNDPAFVACSPLARLLFIGSWNQADDFGVLKDDPERLRLQVLPADEVDAHGLVDELVDADLLIRMVTEDGTAVLVVRTFCEHQKIDSRAVGKWGKPDAFTRPPTDPPLSLPIPPTPIPGKEGKGKDSSSSETSSQTERRADVDQLCDLLAKLIEDNGCKKPTVSKAWRNEARLMLDRDGRDVEEAERVMRWALNDSFWKSNVLSMPKFRDKYDQLKIKANGHARAADSWAVESHVG